LAILLLLPNPSTASGRTLNNTSGVMIDVINHYHPRVVIRAPFADKHISEANTGQFDRLQSAALLKDMLAKYFDV